MSSLKDAQRIVEEGPVNQWGRAVEVADNNGRTEKAATGRKSSTKADLQFSVGCIARFLKKGRYAQGLGTGAPVYLTVVLEYLATEALELAGNTARDNKKNRINPRHVRLSVRNDDELGKLLQGTTIAHGGVFPNINQVLLPKKTSSASEKSAASNSPKKRTSL
ncbi:uncharacterized protein LOC127130087 [Lathyrus oleraceus]|uniref:uncharacterized protein LOC127130087 n=1 Tax=Pisum sativum TaxID=3888 RepID=UPI0021D39617|nr:uncharacterized protein LOC127130087 [Pisum sativum]